MDQYQKRIDKLEIQNIVLQVEIKKLKETVVTLQQKINIQTLNDYGCNNDDDDYLDKINI
jgi:hypothetical protein